jgi:hypothetical protein
MSEVTPQSTPQWQNTKKVGPWESTRSQLYRAARDLGDLQAIDKGPTADGRRVVRKKAYARTNGRLAMVLRDIGL